MFTKHTKRDVYNYMTEYTYRTKIDRNKGYLEKCKRARQGNECYYGCVKLLFVGERLRNMAPKLAALIMLLLKAISFCEMKSQLLGIYYSDTHSEL